MNDKEIRETLALLIDPNALELYSYPWPLDAADRILKEFKLIPRDPFTYTCEGCESNTPHTAHLTAEGRRHYLGEREV